MLVLVAVTLPVIVMLASFVIDVGNWYEHKRHLQLQVDSAALAGGGLYAAMPCSNTAISAEARKYAGPAATGGGTYNPQVGNTPAANLHVLINSTDYYNQGGSDNSAGTPCSTGFVDVKATETDAPWFLKVANLVGLGNPTINAHARVSLKTETTGGGFLPIALPVSDPKLGQVTFVNEATNAVLATSPAHPGRRRQRHGRLGQRHPADHAARRCRRVQHRRQRGPERLELGDLRRCAGAVLHRRQLRPWVSLDDAANVQRWTTAAAATCT